MANKDFDTTITRALERPTAADLNQLQAQLYYTLRRLDRFRYGDTLSATYSGFFGKSFFVQNTTVGETGLVLNISRGMGYQWAAGTVATNIDGIDGLNDLTSYKPLTMELDKPFNLTGQLPTPGKCRRDLLEIRWKRDLVDPTDLSIYDPATKNFNTVNLDKVMTCNLDSDSVQFVESGASVPSSAYLVYRKGVEVAYVNEATFEAAPLPSIDAGFLPLAAINVVAGDINLPNTRIADLRKLLGNERQFFIRGSARFGVNYPANTQHLTSVDISAPVGMRCALSRLNQYQQGSTSAERTQNEYRLSILGPSLAFSPVAVFTPHNDLTVPFSDVYALPVNVSITNKDVGTLDLNTANMLRSSDYSEPALSAAVGQNFWSIDFSLAVSQFTTVTLPDIVYNNSTVANFSFYTAGGVYDTIRSVDFIVMGEYAA